MNQLAPTGQSRAVTKNAEHADSQVFVTVYVAKQLFGIPVERVQDILIPENIARIPLAPPEVAGAINLRGRIVTVLNVRTRLGLPPKSSNEQVMCTTVEQGNELYSLMVDSVGEVMELRLDKIDQNPNTLDPRWRSISAGVVRLDKELMVVLDVDALLDYGQSR